MFSLSFLIVNTDKMKFIQVNTFFLVSVSLIFSSVQCFGCIACVCITI